MFPTDLPEGLEPSADLLHRYTKNASQDAFAGLVRRYAGLVYATALRRTGQHAAAEEVMQLVFADLARRAPALAEDNRLGAWLHRRACMAASDFLKAERRRRQREQIAAALQESADSTPSWKSMAPLLDECLARLPRPDREALVLRFFEGRSLRDVGDALRLSSDAAQKRVSRALERLREGFRREGVVLTIAVLTGALQENVKAAPVTAAAMAKATNVAVSRKTAVSAWCWKVAPRVAPLAAGVAVVCLASAQPLLSKRAETATRGRARFITEPAARTAQERSFPGYEQGLSLEETVQRITDLLVAEKGDYPTRYVYFQELALASSVPPAQHAAALDLLLKMLKERNHALGGNRGHFLYHTWLAALEKNDAGALLERLGPAAPLWLLQLAESFLYNGVRFQSDDDARNALCRRILDDPALSDEHVRRAGIDWFGRAGTGGEIDGVRRPELLAECMDRMQNRKGRGWALAAVHLAKTSEDHVAVLEAAAATLTGTELAKVREEAILSWNKVSRDKVMEWARAQPPRVQRKLRNLPGPL